MAKGGKGTSSSGAATGSSGGRGGALWKNQSVVRDRRWWERRTEAERFLFRGRLKGQEHKQAMYEGCEEVLGEGTPGAEGLFKGGENRDRGGEPSGKKNCSPS